MITKLQSLVKIAKKPIYKILNKGILLVVLSFDQYQLF